MMFAKFLEVLAVENLGAIHIEKKHDRAAVRVVFETQQVTEFMHGRGVDFSAAHLFPRCTADGDLPSKIRAIGELGPSRNRAAQHAGTAVNNSHSAGAEIVFFMEVCGQHGIPKTERPPESLRPWLISVDLDPNISNGWLSQIIELRTRRIRTCPVRFRPLFLTKGNWRGTTGPRC